MSVRIVKMLRFQLCVFAVASLWGVKSSTLRAFVRSSSIKRDRRTQDISKKIKGRIN